MLADEFLAPLNNGTMSPASTMTLNQFIENRYLPCIESEKERSTYAGYGVTQAAYIKNIDSDAVIATQKLERATNMQLEAKNNKPAGRLPVM